MKRLFIRYCQHASPVINYGTLLFLLGICLVSAPRVTWFYWLLLPPAGALTWTFFEYAMHRWLFHLRTRFAPLRILIYMMHGIHHQYSHTTNYVPFLMNIGFYGSGLLVIRFASGPLSYLFYTGFLAAVAFQVYMHNLEHVGKSTHFQQMQQHHHYHHNHPTVNFGISTRLWDKVFGTLH